MQKRVESYDRREIGHRYASLVRSGRLSLEAGSRRAYPLADLRRHGDVTSFADKPAHPSKLEPCSALGGADRPLRAEHMVPARLAEIRPVRYGHICRNRNPLRAFAFPVRDQLSRARK